MSAPTVPTNADDLLESLSDPGKLKAIMESDGGLAGWTKQFRDAFDARDKGATAEQIEAQVQKTIIEMANSGSGANLEFTRHKHDAPEAREARWRVAHAKQGTGYNPAALGAAQDQHFTGTADFLRTIWHKQTNPELVAKANRIRAAYTTEIPADGGFLVPEAFRSTLLEPSLDFAVVRPRATVIPMESGRVAFPMIDTTSYASSVFGGMICYWTEEGAALVESQMKFAKIVLDANKLTGLAIASNESLRDSAISLAALIEQRWPMAIADFEDRAFHTGTGVGEPLGFVGNSATVAVAKESGQAASTIVWENIVKMYARMLPSSLSRAVWLYNPAAFPELATMGLSIGTGGGPVWLSNGAAGPPMTILGRPAIPDDKLSALGTQADIVFADLSYYLIGDRQAVTTDSSEHYRFGNDQTAFRVIERVDGRPWMQSAVTPHVGSDTLSPFVELAVRA